VFPGAAGVAWSPVSVSAASRGTSTHSCDMLRLLPASHWLSPAALAALSATSALVGACVVLEASAGRALVRATGVPSAISVRPAWATVGSV